MIWYLLRNWYLAQLFFNQFHSSHQTIHVVSDITFQNLLHFDRILLIFLSSVVICNSWEFLFNSRMYGSHPLWCRFYTFFQELIGWLSSLYQSFFCCSLSGVEIVSQTHFFLTFVFFISRNILFFFCKWFLITIFLVCLHIFNRTLIVIWAKHNTFGIRLLLWNLRPLVAAKNITIHLWHEIYSDFSWIWFISGWVFSNTTMLFKNRSWGLLSFCITLFFRSYQPLKTLSCTI